MLHWVYLAFAIIAEVLGTSFLKHAEGFTRLWPSVTVIVSYVVAFYFLSMTLKSLPVGIAYAVWAGAGVALIVLVGFVFFDQQLDWPALLGIALIVAGVLTINVFSSAV